jgi:hypothetical protein
MRDWAIFYADESVVEGDDYELWCAAPSDGVIVVVQQSGYQQRNTIHKRDYYYAEPSEHEISGSDDLSAYLVSIGRQSLFEHAENATDLAVRVRLECPAVKFGLMIPTDSYVAVQQRVYEYAGIPNTQVLRSQFIL